MFTLDLLDAARPDSAEVDRAADRVVFQTNPWLSFLTDSQRAEVVIAEVKDGQSTVGRFTGLVVQRYGLRILGSPLPGWTTDYMGFNLDPGVPRRAALEALLPFAFRVLGCSHVEVRDRWLTAADLDGLGVEWSPSPTHLVDLSPDEDVIFRRMVSACRRNIRKAGRHGVVVEPATDPGFADDYYDQLRDVFAKQDLVPTYPVSRVRALLEHLGPSGNLLLLRARDGDGRCIATAILPWFNMAMHVWGSASYRRDQHLRPNEVLMWYAMRFAKQHGLAELDLGGGGSYKSKYGTVESIIPWARTSRSALVRRLRNAVKGGYALRQRVSARVASARGAIEQARGPR